jgi:hypothetical protein
MPEVRILRGTSVQWTAQNPLLDAGEQGYEIDTGRFKIGNGAARWNKLGYFLPKSDLDALIAEAVAKSGDGGTVPENLDEHVFSSIPHPVYDDGPSLLLLYQNAKV